MYDIVKLEPHAAGVGGIHVPGAGIVNYRQGTVNIDLVDNHMKSLVWQGIADGRVEAVLTLAETRDESARDRLAPFMAIERMSVAERNALLQGGDSADRGGEMCACFGVSCAAVESAIAQGATTLDAVGSATQAGTNCGSCRPEIRQLLRAAR